MIKRVARQKSKAMPKENIEAHAGADFVFGKHIGHPGGHADRTAGKAYAVNKPRNYNEAGF